MFETKRLGFFVGAEKCRKMQKSAQGFEKTEVSFWTGEMELLERRPSRIPGGLVNGVSIKKVFYHVNTVCQWGIISRLFAGGCRDVYSNSHRFQMEKVNGDGSSQ